MGFQELDRNLFNSKGISIGEILEISGSSGSGKSTLILGIIVRAILPKQIIYQGEDIPLGGYDSFIEFFDSDLSFNTERLYTLILEFIKEKAISQGFTILPGNNSTTNEMMKCLPLSYVDSIIKRSLKNFHIYYPTNLSELIGNLSTLSMSKLRDGVLNNSQEVNKPAKNIIIIDSLSQFYWALKYGVTKLAKNQYYLNQMELINVLKLCLDSYFAFAIISSITLPPSNSNKVGSLLQSAPASRENSTLDDDDINSSALSDIVNYRLFLSACLSHPELSPESNLHQNETYVSIQVTKPLLPNNKYRLKINDKGVF